MLNYDLDDHEFNSQEWQKARWALRTFPEVIGHEEMGKNATQIVSTYLRCERASESILGMF